MFQFWNAGAVIDLSDLRAFARVAKLRSVSAAARALDAPKSSVSRALTRLEAAVGSTLVERSPHQLRLTDAGTLLLPHAERIMTEVEEAEAALGRFVGIPQGTLRVSAPYAFALGVVTRMLPEFLARYPEVDVVLERDTNWSEMSAGEADLFIRLGPLPETAMVGRRLATVELWTCASPSYLSARGSPATVASLATHDIVGLAGPEIKWSFRNSAGRTEETVLHTRAVLPDTALIQGALAQGAGIGQLPDYMAADSIARGDLMRVLPQFGPATLEAFALYPSHRGLAIKARVFIDALVAHVSARRTEFAKSVSSGLIPKSLIASG